MTRYLFRTTEKLQLSHQILTTSLLPGVSVRLLPESTAELETTLPGVEVLVALTSGLLDFLLTLGKDALQVAGVGHVGVDLEKSGLSRIDKEF